MALGILSMGVNSSTVESAGLVKTLMPNSQNIIRKGNIHLKVSFGFEINAKATAIKIIAAKLIPAVIIGILWPFAKRYLSPNLPAIGGVTTNIIPCTTKRKKERFSNR